ncbi:MAG: hypothetical protein EA376_00695 [Phycisphaeraceae bacterium]|nr:MAG: hypothetical protein EA376_00695 [Phycisphaeraceae bacterium]
MITVEEKVDSPEIVTGPRRSITRRYVIKDETAALDPLDAHAALEAEAPLEYDGLPRRDVRSNPLQASDGETYEGEAVYSLQEVGFSPAPEVGDSVFTFDTSGGTQRITQSIANVDNFAPGMETPPDFGGAINVTEDGVEGADIVAPAGTFSETHYIADATVNAAYQKALTTLTGKVNNAEFRGYAAGEVLFLGASGQMRGAPGSGSPWEITFRFAVSENRTSFSVGGVSDIDKEGWELLWVRYGDAESEGVPVKKPISVHVEQVYEKADFAGLGIGTS